MDTRGFSQLVEEAVNAASPEKVLRCIARIESALPSAPAEALAHVMHRLVLSAATDSHATQRNAITLFLHFLRSHPSSDAAKLDRLVAEETDQTKAVSKGERKHFSFAQVALSFILLNERNSGKKTAERLFAAASKSPFALFALSGLFSVFPASPAALELLLRLCALPPAHSFHSFDFLLTAEGVLLQHAETEKRRERRQGLVGRLREVTRALRDFFQPAAFFATLESAQNDLQFSGRAELLGTARKAAQFVLRNASSRGKLVAPLLDEFSQRAEGQGALGRAAAQLFLAFAAELAAGRSLEEAEWAGFCRFVQAATRLPGLRQQAEAVRVGLLGRLAAGSDGASAGYFLQEWFIAGRGAVEAKSWRALLGMLGPEQADAALQALRERLEGGVSLVEAQAALDRLGLLASAAPAETRQPAAELIVQLYHRAEEAAARLSEDRTERSTAALAQELRAAAHQQLLHKLLPALSFPELQTVAGLWAAEGDAVAAECLSVAPQLLAAGEEDLGRCLLACLLQHHRAEVAEHTSLLFNQVVDDLLAFSERLLADPADIAAQDLHVLTDALLCLLGAESAALRGWINRVFARFAGSCDEECVKLLEDAFFNEGEALPPPGESSEEMSDIEIPGKLL